ncbi:TonB-dependent siderophore receptor [Chryseobacterium sp. BIGb0232]|uniref:TonB-dependent receptor plug domain-containing protein n=1 Tax=Chryseobacterium sp. BIGb0232 TaxID=2940598 RepID=UPI000F46443E|nr:TonB-dependent receptor [Chryseobacterium sp. BIGb0232]MCS4303056.1 iron complex outermembrane receptor protein [Chryseobacterium sp. BIGb0232]ROS14656.1 iron complex outermembrane receptor protein [Chryseobacterium nakagawai]
MKQFGIILIFLGVTINAQHQKVKKDSIAHLAEVKVKSNKKKIETDMKMAVSVDEFLASSDKISFIKRGAYAWEPLLNNMSTERSVITLDGMRIFGACTDKMDPVTSYMESNNLSGIDIKSGQEGSSHGATVAGSIDLKRKSTSFGLEKKWNGTYQTGFEFNNKQFFNLGNISYSGKKLVVDGSISFRKAGNYYDGNDAEVNHSQYNKFNTGIGIAYKASPLSSIKVDAIFDMAKNVGFPALPMDLWLSRAVITSASYRQLFKEGLIKSWDTKIYFNTIEHYMDDTNRPENLVHMDMPGWSTTYGLVSSMNLTKERYTSDIEINAYNNTSIAEMRMYPQDRKNRTMFAYSWPWVTTRFASLSMNNKWDISDKSRLSFGGSLGLNYNESKYVEFNWIFHPGASQQKTRILPSLHAGYQFTNNHFNFSVGTGYGHRAPSVSEGYGYYIYNSFDRYDYIGNPDLKNEISYETNASTGFKNEKMSIEAKVNYFYIQNYIIGKILSMGSPMNYQSVGVKAYTSLDHATLFNMSLNANYSIIPDLHWKGTITYARGRDDKGKNLPFIRPLSYLTSLHYTHGNFGIQTSVNGDFIQLNYSPEYGEDQTPAYTIWNFSMDYTFRIKKLRTVFQVGAENLLNKYYSTYADWGNIPRMGRNIYTSLKFNF